MKEDPFQEGSTKVLTELFADPAASLFGQGGASCPPFPTALRLALWLEFFLRGGAEAVKTRLLDLPEEELTALAISWLRCYLSQPLYLRIYRGETPSSFKQPLNFFSLGRLYQVDQGIGRKRRTEILYPLDHQRLWPEALELLPEKVFLSPVVLKALEPALQLTRSSRLEKIRQRGERLAALFRPSERGTGVFAPASEPSGRVPREEGPPPAAQPALENPSGGKEASDPAADFPSPPSKGPRRKRKPRPEQLKLFS